MPDFTNPENIKTPDFRNPELRVRINPETYLKFDGSARVSLSNIYSNNAISVQSDILLVLWDLVDWKSMGELTAPWPPEDRQKIAEHLEMLSHYKIIVTQEEQSLEAPSASSGAASSLASKVGAGIHFDVYNHYRMLRDTVRLSAYRRALERVIAPDSAVLDLGCGTGILSFFAAKSGAAKVYAVEKRASVLALAQAIARENGLDRIEFVEALSTALPVSRLDPRPDILVSEIIGEAVLNEHILEFTLDARDRLLKPGGTLIPWRLDLYVFGYHSNCPLIADPMLEVDAFRSLYGVDYRLFGELLQQTDCLRLGNYNAQLNRRMTAPVLAKSLDFRTMDSKVFTEAFELVVDQDGELTGYCVFFKAWLDPDGEITLTNAPWSPQTSWDQLLYTLGAPRPMRRGETLPLRVVYDGQLRFQPCG